MAGDFRLQWMTARAASCQWKYLLDTMHFRIGLETILNDSQMSITKPEDFKVELWTNLYHKNDNDGEWHSVPMTYQGTRQKVESNFVYYIYGVDLTLTCLGKYSFTYRAKLKYDTEYTWIEKFEVDGIVHVKQPVIEYTTYVQEPVMAQITHNIYIGNYTAAMKAPENGFDCLLNMADDAPIYAEQFVHPIIFRKFPIPAGANNPISEQVINTVVRWLRAMSDRCKKIMVCSRAGRGRAGSILLAFIFFMNPNLTFQEAFNFVEQRFPIYNHKGLRDTVRKLYRANYQQQQYSPLL